MSGAPLKWEAIGVGAATGIGIGLAWTVVLQVIIAPGSDAGDRLEWLQWSGAIVALVADIACGAVAGWIARERGAAHAAIANVIAIAVGIVTGAALTAARGHGFGWLGDGAYWGQFLLYAIPGIAIAAIAGATAASLRRARERTAPPVP